MAMTDLQLQRTCKGLSDKQRVFVFEYTVDYNATRAAKVAKYSHPHVAGRKLLNNSKVSAAVARIQSLNLKQSVLTKEEIIAELCTLAMRDPIDLCDEDGQFVCDDLRKIPAHFRRAIDGLEIEKFVDDAGVKRQKFKIKLVGKATVLRMLADHFGLNAPQEHKHQHSINWDELFKHSAADHDVVDAEIKSVRVLTDES